MWPRPTLIDFILLFWSDIFFVFQCCALNFIENLSAQSLNLPQSEFQSYMSGNLVPPYYVSYIFVKAVLIACSQETTGVCCVKKIVIFWYR